MNEYRIGMRLHHHAGSTWEVERRAPNGDYGIRCIVGTRRPGWIGGEEAGAYRVVHPDYLHGDGWMREEDAPSRAMALHGKR